MQSDAPVLAVDLDGTLCRTDTLHETLLNLAAKSPWQFFKSLRWLLRGKANFKSNLADRGVISLEALPLNLEVMETLRDARAKGRRTVLVSASDHRQVTVVADATGLFDEAYGTADGRNLKGARKANFLIQRFGEKGFDYIGDAKADIPVWAAANKAITVNAGNSLRRAAEAANSNTVHIADPTGTALASWKALRPHQWSKNALLFLPMLAAHDLGSFPQVILGFLAFSLTASTVYIINDLMDLVADRAHPRKKHRPFASGAISAARGMSMSLVLIALAITFGIMTDSSGFCGVLAGYFFTTFAYTLWLKHKLIIDVLTLGGLYTLRVIAGGVAAGIDLSPWMLGFSIFIFLALAAVKRQAELMDQLATGRDFSGRSYEVQDLPVLRSIAISAGHSAVLVLGLYISSGEVQRLYSFSEPLWVICPLLLYWILRMVMKAHRGSMTDDPIVFAATDRVSILVIMVCVFLAYTAAFWF